VPGHTAAPETSPQISGQQRPGCGCLADTAARPPTRDRNPERIPRVESHANRSAFASRAGTVMLRRSTDRGRIDAVAINAILIPRSFPVAPMQPAARVIPVTSSTSPFEFEPAARFLHIRPALPGPLEDRGHRGIRHVAAMRHRHYWTK
jgi:hypothetical protein